MGGMAVEGSGAIAVPGGGDPVAAVGGGFDITGSGYEASGIFAADK